VYDPQIGHPHNLKMLQMLDVAEAFFSYRTTIRRCPRGGYAMTMQTDRR
jgi:hypothetical protein